VKYFLSILIYLFTYSLHAATSNKIIAEDDLTPVKADNSNIPVKYKNITNAFGMLSMGCTATHIGNGYAITAAHCFDKNPKYLADQLLTNLNCMGTSIIWGYQQGKPAYLQSQCTKILFLEKSELNDFAIIKVSPVPTAFVEVEMNRKAQLMDILTLFSYPQRLPLRWSKLCAMEFDVLYPVNKLQHNCDTNNGSSGAALIDNETLKIVGIHEAGRITAPPNIGMNYGTFLTNDSVLKSLIELGFK
jgi:V8-like Glu-specific endopeptidase